MKQVYYDAFRTGLVPVKVLRPAKAEDVAFPCSHDNQFLVEVSRSTGAYKRGERLVLLSSSLVHKAGVRNGRIYVTSWQPKEAA
jgi:hypothetical protein